MPRNKEHKSECALVYELSNSTFGFVRETIGKTEAREKLLPLIDGLLKKNNIVEITDHGKPKAVLISYTHFLALLGQVRVVSKPKHMREKGLMGTVKIVGNLAAGSKKLATEFEQAVKRSAEQLQ
jgi:prevent-host-death family protein